MGLFSKKKEEVKEQIKPPKFPGLAEPSFPSYEPSFPDSTDSFKQAVKKPLFPEMEAPREIPK